MSLIAILPRIVLASSLAPCMMTATGVLTLVKYRFSIATIRARTSLARALLTASSFSASVFMPPCSSSILASVRSFNSSLNGFSSASARINSSPLLKPNISAARSGASPPSIVMPRNLVKSTAGAKPVVLVGYMPPTATLSILLPTSTSISLPSGSTILPVLKNRSALRTGSLPILSDSSLRITFRNPSSASCIFFKNPSLAPDSHFISLTVSLSN